MLGVLLQAKQNEELHGSAPQLLVPNTQEELISRPEVIDLMGAELLF